VSVGNRTTEERERARAERAQRRAVDAPLPVPQPPGGAEPATAAGAMPPAGAEPARAVGRTAPPLRVPPQGPASGGRRGRPGRRLGLALAALALVAVGAFALARLLPSSKPAPVPSPPVQIVRVTIPEGETRAQIAQIAAAKGLRGSYLEAADRASRGSSPLLDPARYGAPQGTRSLEGFLFPATYELYAGAPAGQLVSEQLQAFTERFGPAEVRRARALHETPYQLLTVASMVEREAQVPGDRAKIAAVIYNRLRLGMPLGIDATIYYAVEQQRGIATYTGELTEAQLHIDSPYNTRTHTGLPPTPISNPGAASIEAAAHPAHVSYLYYVAGADGCGEQVFSNTPAEFEVNVAAYRAAVQRAGGHPPTCRRKG
jgi:UPF0755 protein